jgi:hypothetical protein
MIDPKEWAELREDIGYIKAKVEDIAALKDDVDDLQRNQWMMGGLATVLGTLAGIFGH